MNNISNMKSFTPIFEDCLMRLSNGTASIDECLRRYPEYAEQLRPLLQTALFLNRGHDVMPSETFNAYTRFVMVQHIRSQTRSRAQHSAGFSWRMAMTFALLIGALIVTGTVHAQSVLPGDLYYGWKRTSESAWRALAPDSVAVDLSLANRRLDEWIAVANNPDLNISAKNDYQVALSKLASADNAKSLAVVTPALELQRRMLNDAGLSAPELNDYLAKIADSACAPNCASDSSSNLNTQVNSPDTDPCLDNEQAPCGQGDNGNGNPTTGSENANCNASQGEVDPSCNSNENNNGNGGGQNNNGNGGGQNNNGNGGGGNGGGGNGGGGNGGGGNGGGGNNNGNDR